MCRGTRSLFPLEYSPSPTPSSSPCHSGEKADFPFAYFVEGLSLSPLRSSAKRISIFYLGCRKWNMKVGPEIYKSKGRAINLSLQNAFELLMNRTEIHSSPFESVFIFRLLCLVRHKAQRGDCVDKFHRDVVRSQGFCLSTGGKVSSRACMW